MLLYQFPFNVYTLVAIIGLVNVVSLVTIIGLVTEACVVTVISLVTVIGLAILNVGNN